MDIYYLEEWFVKTPYMLLTYMYYILQFDLIVDSKSDKGWFKVIDCIVPSSEYWCPNTKWLIFFYVCVE